MGPCSTRPRASQGDTVERRHRPALGPKLWDGTAKETLLGFKVVIPGEIDGRGVTVGTLGNFQHKQFVVDLVQARTKPKELEAQLVARLGESEGRRVLADLRAIAGEIAGRPNGLVEALKTRPTCARRLQLLHRRDREPGHRFGGTCGCGTRGAEPPATSDGARMPTNFAVCRARPDRRCGEHPRACSPNAATHLRAPTATPTPASRTSPRWNTASAGAHDLAKLTPENIASTTGTDRRSTRASPRPDPRRSLRGDLFIPKAMIGKRACPRSSAAAEWHRGDVSGAKLT